MSDISKTTNPEWFTVTEASKHLLVDGRTVRRWIQEGHFPNAVRTSPKQGRYLIPKSDIEAFERERKVS